ncbi:hypothetical protein BN4901_4025 [Citrobacter europaeus]|uniref:Uncharacterized protein n=1 Tax=Citrobacter europaeus TaxID=1914243 RepID=A0ABY0JUE0_9ENTR|nr:hypothetical protein BN4901_4025 [Citrobacter europaeus]
MDIVRTFRPRPNACYRMRDEEWLMPTIAAPFLHTLALLA